MRQDEFIMEVYRAVEYLLEDVVTPERISNTIRHLDIGDDILLPSTAEVKIGLVWDNLQDWLTDEGHSLEDYPLDLIEGICGTQAHTWIECSTTKHDLRQDPVSPVFILDIAPPNALPQPILIGPGSPFRMLYRRRVTK